MIYKSFRTHRNWIGALSLLAILGVFNSLPSSASVINSPVDTNNNSQSLSLLAPNYSVEIPQAIGGPSDIHVNNRLALLSPQVGVITGNISVKNIDVDPDGIVVYVVQEGDTLSEIAESFDVSINTIKWENNLGNTIKPGQELRILPVTGVRHTITKGDTFSKIAQTYDVETEDITVFNDINADKLVVGKKIIIPNGVKQTVVRSVTVSGAVSKIKTTTNTYGDGYYIRPTTGPVTSLFGPRWGKYHYGIDYGVSTGTPIVATASGTVLKTSCGTGYGKCLVIQHKNGTQSLYAHNSKIYVTTGTNVIQGQKIAASGATGNVTGPHLHFEIIKSNGSKMNVNFLK